MLYMSSDRYIYGPHKAVALSRRLAHRLKTGGALCSVCGGIPAQGHCMMQPASFSMTVFIMCIAIYHGGPGPVPKHPRGAAAAPANRYACTARTVVNDPLMRTMVSIKYRCYRTKASILPCAARLNSKCRIWRHRHEFSHKGPLRLVCRAFSASSIGYGPNREVMHGGLS